MPEEERTESGSAGQPTGGTGGPFGDQQQDQGPGKPAESDKEWKIEDLPPGAQDLIRSLRGEAASARTTAKKTAAEQARAEILATLGKALGMGDQPPDPERLAKDLESRTSKLRAAQVELAVARSAGAAGADPEVLLDSNTFMKSVADLDPEDSGFQHAVADKIAQAVKDNPRYRAEQTSGGKGGGEISGKNGDTRNAGTESWEEVDKLVKDARRRR